MWQRLQSGIRRLGSTWTDDDLANPQLAASLIKVGNTWRVKQPYNISPTASAAGIPNGGTQTIYTVTAGRLPVLGGFVISCSVAGFITLRYNAINFVTAIMAANTNVTLSIPEGLVFPTTGGVFDVFNLTGVAASLAGSLVLSEYLP